MQFHLGYVTETIWNHNFYLPSVCHLTSDLKVFIVYTRRSKSEFQVFQGHICRNKIPELGKSILNLFVTDIHYQYSISIGL